MKLDFEESMLCDVVVIKFKISDSLSEKRGYRWGWRVSGKEYREGFWDSMFYFVIWVLVTWVRLAIFVCVVF